jgi:hypothetical protein
MRFKLRDLNWLQFSMLGPNEVLEAQQFVQNEINKSEWHKQAMESFASNLVPLASLSSLPLMWANYGVQYEFARVEARLKLKMDAHETLENHADRILEIAALQKKILGGEEMPIAGVTIVNHIPGPNLPHAGVFAPCELLLTLAITSAWTIFEVLAVDLWAAAVNTLPDPLARLSGQRKRIERLIKGSKGPKIEDGGSQADAGKTISLTDLHALADGNYDFRNRVGDLIQSRMKFTTLSGVRGAYSQAFSENEKAARTDSIDKALADESLDALCAVRNLIVHKAHIADQTYKDDILGNNLAPKLEIGQPLELDGQMVRSLIRPVISTCIAMIVGVKNWVELVEADYDKKSKKSS